ncbi:MAG: pyridoxamine 5'-phosphate oxidase family protein [Tannerella sp.]|jgi:nitroimidazol reductase NimA-like FMN-containing flavoprotein (pyridoxamine 5'-phosphate oxidase superfamily)|nr:pyridoxamine 5'-phosphate oxidase family protein [Tannerella sp.]
MEIRRKDRILDDKRAIELLQTAEYGFLSLGESEDGYAYGIPISFAYNLEDNALYFHCAPEGHKLENMKRNNKVSFCVVGNTQVLSKKFTTLYESVIVFGKADVHPSEEDKWFALRKLIEKYCPNDLETGEQYIRTSIHRTHTFKITIERMTAKAKAQEINR